MGKTEETMRTLFAIIAGTALVTLALAVDTSAVDYKEYRRTRLLEEYFQITCDKEQITVTAYSGDSTFVSILPRSDIKARQGEVYAGDELLFDKEGLLMEGQHFYYDSIADSRITREDDAVEITFLSRKTTADRVTRFKRGNVIEVGQSVIIDSDDFVRGLVLAIDGNIEVLGEVNKDVVAILGDVYIGPSAVARGDVATISGRVDVDGDASVYGDVFDPDSRSVRRRHRFARWDNPWDFIDKLTYDRVDGLGIHLGVGYSDPDSLLPSFSALAGYAFNSDRWRFHINLEQCLWRQPAVVLGGSLYRRLATDDSWLIGDDENTAFALMATEDFRDYYEAEGGSLFAKTVPIEDVIFETGYRFEETNWLDARRHLWSLFGGSKLFPENFGTVEDGFRTMSIAEIDTTANAVWYSHADWDTRVKDDPFDESAWHVTANFEWSHESFNSDFNYRRYTLAVRRYQKVNRRAMVIARGVFGGSDGYLPMYRRFFLGGLGTLRGYDHKEYMGTRFWLVNTEYRINFPRLESALSVFWDVGQIANEQKLDGSIEIKNNLGLAAYIEDDFKVSLAKRLDRSYDDNPIFYVRLDHLF